MKHRKWRTFLKYAAAVLVFTIIALLIVYGAMTIILSGYPDDLVMRMIGG